MLIKNSLLLSLSFLVNAESEKNADLTILHINDTHSYVAGVNEQGNYCTDENACRGGYARIAQLIKDKKAQNPNTIALHAGDTYQGSLFFVIHGSKMLGDLDSLIPYDAITLGNHEFDNGCRDLADYLRKLPQPILAANLNPTKENFLVRTGIKPYLIKELANGDKVGIIGLANDNADELLRRECKGVSFLNSEEILRKSITELKTQGVKRIVVLTHLGLPEDMRLAQAVEDIDIIVGGHTHNYIGEGADYPYPIVLKNPKNEPVLVITAAYATQYLGEIKLNFDKDGVLTNWTGAAIPLNPELPRDEAVSKKVNSYVEGLHKLRAEVIGSHEVIMNDGMDGCREAECFGALLFADALLDYGKKYGAKIALVNSGSVRASLPAGNITKGDILNIFPFQNRIVVKEFTGAEILAALENGVKGEGDELLKGKVAGPRILQAAGLVYTADERKAPMHRVVKAEVVDNLGHIEPLEKNKKYIVLLTDYLAKGGDAFTVLTKGRTLNSQEPREIDVIIDYLLKKSPIKEIKTGRLKIIRD